MAKSKVEKKAEKDLLYIAGFFVFLIVLFLVVSAIFQSFNKVEYEGLIFAKEKFGEIPVYHATYSFRSPITGDVINYHLFVRNNPLENDIPIEGDKITYGNEEIYITYDTINLDKCEDFSLAAVDIARFYSDNQFDVKAANMNPLDAKEREETYATCETNPNDNVLQIHIGDGETRINVDGSCIDLTIGDDCRILEATEKLKIHSYIDAQRR